MTSITTRAGKGSPLTHNEVDANFTNLNNDKLDTAGIALGSAASPTLKFTGDANTGIYSPGADQLAVATNGTGRLFVDANGRVGIGTTSPATALHVSTNQSSVSTFQTSGADLYLRFQNSVNTGGYVGYNSSALTLWTTDTERLRIDSSGQLTIAAKANGLTNGVIFNVPYTGGQANGISQCLQVAGTGNVNALARINMSTVDLANNNAGYISFATSPGGIGPASGDLTTERMRIDSSGNVGIGTSSPVNKLTVAGATVTAAIFNTSPGTVVSPSFCKLNFYGYLADSNGNVASISAGNSQGNNYAGILRFATNAADGTHTTAVTIDGSQRVGIGTTSPTTLLDVNADTVRVRTARTPASASATGAAGEICWDANYIYVCTATNTWKRSALSTW
jgi:hypothetical protein